MFGSFFAPVQLVAGEIDSIGRPGLPLNRFPSPKEAEFRKSPREFSVRFLLAVSWKSAGEIARLATQWDRRCGDERRRREVGAVEGVR